MKLVPLGDRVVLKQVEAEETTKSDPYNKRTGETTGSRSNRCRTWRNGRW